MRRLTIEMKFEDVEDSTGEVNITYSTTTQVYNHLEYAELVTIQRAVADSLLGLGEKRVKAEAGEADPKKRR